MKKVYLSALLVSTFASYALYVRLYAPDALNALPALNPTLDRNALGTGIVSRLPVPSAAPPTPVTDPSTQLPVVTNTSATAISATEPALLPTPAPVNSQLNLQAQGSVWITNAYQTPLTLIKTTRLLSADGKLFRLATTLVLPAHGQTSAQVYADQNGSLYAISPTSFTIPGLSPSLQQFVTVKSDSTFAMARPLSTPSSGTAANTTNIAVAPTAPTPQPSPAPKPTPVPVQSVPVSVPVPTPAPTPQGQYRDGTYTGNSADAYYGNVQVAAVIQGGKIVDVQFLDHPQDRNRSVMINNYAMPYLTSEAIQAQSAQVDGVSGATATSGAFVQSLSSALSQAKT